MQAAVAMNFFCGAGPATQEKTRSEFSVPDGGEMKFGYSPGRYSFVRISFLNPVGRETHGSNQVASGNAIVVT